MYFFPYNVSSITVLEYGAIKAPVFQNLNQSTISCHDHGVKIPSYDIGCTGQIPFACRVFVTIKFPTSCCPKQILMTNSVEARLPTIFDITLIYSPSRF